MTPEEIDRVLRQVLLKDLRTQCRARGLSPAGGKEQLSERLKEHMIATKDYTLKNEAGEDLVLNSVAGTASADVAKGFAQNNYQRPCGQQNVGNFITDRASSRVLAPPGGKTSICFGNPDGPAEEAAHPSPRNRQPLPLSPAAKAGIPAGLPPAPLGPGALVVGDALAKTDAAAPIPTKAPPKANGSTAGGNSQIIFG